MSSPWIDSAWLYIPAVFAAVAAVWMLHAAVFRDRSRGRRRCPQCWYDMSGVPGLTCPECGKATANEARLHATRRRPLLAVAASLLALPLPALVVHRHGYDILYAVLPKWKSDQRLVVVDVVAESFQLRDHRDRGARAVVRYRGTEVLDVQDAWVEFGQDEYNPVTGTRGGIIGAGTDLNNDGTADLVIFGFSGGAHCCYTVYVVELCSPPRIVGEIDGRNGLGLRRLDPNAEGRRETVFDIADQTFDYWNAPHVASPMPSVYYRLQDHQLRLAPELMLAPAITESELAARAAAIRAATAAADSELDSTLWRTMLELLYSGNDGRAWSFFDSAWPETRPGKEAFIAEFRKMLSESPQWRDFQAALAAASRGEQIPAAVVAHTGGTPLSAPAGQASGAGTAQAEP